MNQMWFYPGGLVNTLRAASSLSTATGRDLRCPRWRCRKGLVHAVEVPAGHAVAGARGGLAWPCVVIPLLGMTYDACVSRELRLRCLNVAGSGFAARCFRNLGKTEAGRRSASWSRFDNQRPSVGCHDLVNDRQ